MSHNIISDSSGTFYCTKCGVRTELNSVTPLSPLCESALYEEKLKRETDIMIGNIKRDSDDKMFFLSLIGLLGFFFIIFNGFERITGAIQEVHSIANSAYIECSKGGLVRLIKSMFSKKL